MYKFLVSIEYCQYSVCEVISIPKQEVDRAKIDKNIIIKRRIREALDKKGMVEWGILWITNE